MSESEQDALLDKIESRRRWHGMKGRALAAIAGACALAAGVAYLIVR